MCKLQTNEDNEHGGLVNGSLFSLHTGKEGPPGLQGPPGMPGERGKLRPISFLFYTHTLMPFMRCISLKVTYMCINWANMYVWFGRIFISTWNFANSFDCFNEETILIYLVDIKNVN